jgi:hypothetical protein
MKPVRTGKEIKSSSHPSLKIPSSRERIPTENEISGVIMIGLNPNVPVVVITWPVRRPITDVGPVLISEARQSSYPKPYTLIVPLEVPIIK